MQASATNEAIMLVFLTVFSKVYQNKNRTILIIIWGTIIDFLGTKFINIICTSLFPTVPMIKD